MENKNLTSIGWAVSFIFAVIIGFVIYFSFAASMEPTADVRVVELKILTSNSHGLITATLQNTGTIKLENVSVTIFDDDSAEIILRLNTLAPGETKGAENRAGKWTSGKLYIVRISFFVPRRGEMIRVFTEMAS